MNHAVETQAESGGRANSLPPLTRVAALGERGPAGLLEAWDVCFEHGVCTGACRALFAGTRVWDAHVHLGRDRDGREVNLGWLLGEIDRYGVERCLVFPLDQPGPSGDFGAANAGVLAAALRHRGRLLPFFRLDPRSRWQPEYERWLRWGFRGIKLHPRAQRFAIDDKRADGIFARAERDRLPVLLHTGWGTDRPAERTARVLARHPDLRLILGHACFVDLERAIRLLGGCENVVFETSIAPVYDLAHLLVELGPDRLVLGSDPPYGTLGGALQALVGAALAAGERCELVRPALGDNLARLLGET